MAITDKLRWLVSARSPEDRPARRRWAAADRLGEDGLSIKSGIDAARCCAW